MADQSNLSYLVDKYFYASQMPTMWCPGCGNGVVAMSMCRAIERMGLDQPLRSGRLLPLLPTAMWNAPLTYAGWPKPQELPMWPEVLSIM
jgi:hypothetical protein